MGSLNKKLTELLTVDWQLLEADSTLTPIVVEGSLSIALLIIAGLVHFLVAPLLTKYITKMFTNTKNTWDDELVTTRFIKRVTRLFPAIVLWKFLPEIITDEFASNTCRSIFSVYLILLTLWILYSTLNTLSRLYDRKEISKEIPITGITQTIKIILAIASGIMILSVVLGKSPVLIFSGFGALTAILMLVFRDPILGLAAGIQLSSNKLIAVGDWVEVPKYGADGNVLELALTTVKIQNWDKTITTIPTYALISESFKNWQGMSESGLRRIKRNLILDMNSVSFLDPEQITELKKNNLISEYLNEKLNAIEAAKGDLEFPQQMRRLTNLGTFRAYVYAYLKAHNKISTEGTQLVRQLQSTAQGLPLEVYCFSTDNRWVNYENIQSDIFDHLISVLPEFGLQIFQEPSGKDFRNL